MQVLILIFFVTILLVQIKRLIFFSINIKREEIKLEMNAKEQSGEGCIRLGDRVPCISIIRGVNTERHHPEDPLILPQINL